MGIRTPDLLIANETLYQLSYTPNKQANFPIAKTRPNANTERSLHPCSLTSGKEAFEELPSRWETKGDGKRRGDPADSLLVRGWASLPGNPTLEGVPTL